MPATFVDRINASKRVGGQLNIAATMSIITDSMVSTHSATLSGLKSAILSVGQAGRPDNYPIAIKTIEAINVGKDLSLWAENHAHSSVASLVSATDGEASRRIGIWS